MHACTRAQKHTHKNSCQVAQLQGQQRRTPGVLDKRLGVAPVAVSSCVSKPLFLRVVVQMAAQSPCAAICTAAAAAEVTTVETAATVVTAPSRTRAHSEAAGTASNLCVAGLAVAAVEGLARANAAVAGLAVAAVPGLIATFAAASSVAAPPTRVRTH